MMDWETLKAACAQCHNCALGETRHNVVFGVGNEHAEVMFIGEGPGENEDLQGEPFVGAAGHLLDDMLEIIGLKRSQVYIANIVKCRPPHNRDPLNTEQDACIAYLRAQVALIQPKIIVCLGRIAAMRLIRSNFKITREHGQWTEKGGVQMMAIYHPTRTAKRQAQGRPLPKTSPKRKALPQSSRAFLFLFFCPFARAALLALFDTLGQQILDLAVDGAKIVLRPSGQILPQLRGNAQKELLLPLFLLFQSRSPPLVNSVSAFRRFGKPFRPALRT